MDQFQFPHASYPQLTLLLMETLQHHDKHSHIDEIFFERPIRLQQIRIIRPGLIPHPNLNKQFKSLT